jgi:hypothetical protein
VRETSLAWALAEATNPHLNAVERSDVHLHIGHQDERYLRGLVEQVLIPCAI